MLYIFLAVLSLCCTFCYAAELTLERALQLGWAHHPELEISLQDLTLADLAILLEEQAFRPQAMLQSKGRYVDEHQHLSLRQIVNLKSSHGATLEAAMEQKAGHWQRRGWGEDEDLGLTLSVTQPLLKGRTKLYNQYGLNSVKLSQLTTQYQHRLTQQMVLQDILFAYRAVQLVTLNLNLQMHLLDGIERLEKIVDQKIALGKMPEIEGAHIRLQVQKERVAYKQMADAKSLAWLKLWDALGLPKDMTFDTVALPHDQDVLFEDKELVIQRGVDEDLKLKMLKLGKEQAEQSLQKAKQEAWWDLSLKLQSTMGSTWNRAFSQFKPHVGTGNMAQLTLSVPLGHKKETILIENQAIALRKVNLTIAERCQKVKINVERLWQDLENLKLQKQSAKEWLDLARQSLELTQKKLEFGRSTMVELMHYTDQMQLAEIQYARTTIAVLNAKTELDYATGQLVEVWREKAALF